jgi:hypothetical protein
MKFNGKPTVRRRDENRAARYPTAFLEEIALTRERANMLDHGGRMYNVKRSIAKRQACGVGPHKPHAGKFVAKERRVVDADSRYRILMRIPLLEIV